MIKKVLRAVTSFSLWAVIKSTESVLKGNILQESTIHEIYIDAVIHCLKIEAIVWCVNGNKKQQSVFHFFFNNPLFHYIAQYFLSTAGGANVIAVLLWHIGPDRTIFFGVGWGGGVIAFSKYDLIREKSCVVSDRKHNCERVSVCWHLHIYTISYMDAICEIDVWGVS